MRIGGQLKMGFYPTPPEAMSLLATHFRLHGKQPDKCRILDPCCGEGAALKQLGQALGVPEDRLYGMELHKPRAEAARAAMPGAHIEGPASYLDARVSPHSFGLIYLNPPFDSEIGGGKREERRFVERAIYQLAPDGVLCLVVPWATFADSFDFVKLIDAQFRDVRVYRFPQEAVRDGETVVIRKYREIVIIGVKRVAAIPSDQLETHGQLVRLDWGRWNCPKEYDLPVLGDPHPVARPREKLHSWQRDQWEYGPLEAEVAVYEVPPSGAPNVFKKNAMTEQELADAIRESPINRMLASTPDIVIDRPPLPPGKGHVSQMLASGMLDGVVPCGEFTHVVRGSSRKVSYLNLALSTTTENEDGSTTIKEVYSERIDLVIRTVERSGVIRTFEPVARDEPPVARDEPPPAPEASEPASARVNVVVTPSPATDKAEADLKRGDLVAAIMGVLGPCLRKADLANARRSYKVVWVPTNPISDFDGYLGDWGDVNLRRYQSVEDARREADRLNDRDLGTNARRAYFVMGTDDEPNDLLVSRVLSLPDGR